MRENLSLFTTPGHASTKRWKIAEKVCQNIHEMVPEIIITYVGVNTRGTLLYLDPSQNDLADRIAAPYYPPGHDLQTV